MFIRYYYYYRRRSRRFSTSHSCPGDEEIDNTEREEESEVNCAPRLLRVNVDGERTSRSFSRARAATGFRKILYTHSYHNILYIYIRMYIRARMIDNDGRVRNARFTTYAVYRVVRFFKNIQQLYTCVYVCVCTVIRKNIHERRIIKSSLRRTNTERARNSSSLEQRARVREITILYDHTRYSVIGSSFENHMFQKLRDSAYFVFYPRDVGQL